jgi:ribosomal protein L7/L12
MLKTPPEQPFGEGKPKMPNLCDGNHIAAMNHVICGTGGGGGPAAAAAPEAPKEVQTEFNVKLEGFEAASKIKVIKEIRALSELGLKEAKELVRDLLQGALEEWPVCFP